MSLGLIAKKCGMSRIFKEDGTSVPVSVLLVGENKISQIKTLEVDGYTSLQLTYGEKKPSRVTKPMQGHFAKANIKPGIKVQEFRLDDVAQLEAYQLGQSLTVEVFTEGQVVDVTGISKGKGFAGVVKRHNFSMQDATHGNSLSHRAHGSTGQNQTPGRVFKGKKMAGQMGNETKTVSGLEVAAIDVEKGILFIKGGVPGAPGGIVTIKPSVKNSSNGSQA